MECSNSMDVECSREQLFFKAPTDNKRLFSGMNSTDEEIQSAASNFFSHADVRGCIEIKLGLADIYALRLVSTDFTFYKKAFIRILNSGRTLREISIKTLEKFIDFLGPDSHLLTSLNLEPLKITEQYDVHRCMFFDRIENIVECLPNLTSLSLSGCDIKDPLESLAPLTKLNLLNLNLSKCTEINEFMTPFQSLNAIKDLNSLTSLDISRSSRLVNDTALYGLTNLRSINLAKNPTKLNFLQYCTKLMEINLHGCSKEVSFQPFNKFFKGNKYIDRNGDVYEGQIVNGQNEGHLIHHNSKGVKIFEGYVSAGLGNGSGSIFYNNGNAKYIGNFLCGHSNGQGTLFNSQGKKIYEGNFFKNEPCGNGILYLANDDVFVGNFKAEQNYISCEGVTTSVAGVAIETRFSFYTIGSFLNNEMEIESTLNNEMEII